MIPLPEEDEALEGDGEGQDGEAVGRKGGWVGAAAAPVQAGLLTGWLNGTVCALSGENPAGSEQSAEYISANNSCTSLRWRGPFNGSRSTEMSSWDQSRWSTFPGMALILKRN